MLEGFVATCACRPVPFSATVSEEFDASLVTVSVPVAGVIDVGANWTCTVSLCPAAREAVPLPLTTVKAPLEIEAPDIFTVWVPVLDTLTLRVAVLPTATLPKLRPAGDGVRVLLPELPGLPLLVFAAFDA